MMHNKGRTPIAAGKHLALVQRDGWEYAERTGAAGVVAVIAVTAENRLLLTEQHRIPVGCAVVDLPAGLVDDDEDGGSESPEDAARRELTEEVGYEADRLTRLAEWPTSPGLTSETVTLFRAEELRKVGTGGGEGSERITVREVALDDLDDWLQDARRTGKAVDPKVYVALDFLLRPR